jgi:protein-disulfide isomerase
MSTTARPRPSARERVAAQQAAAARSERRRRAAFRGAVVGALLLLLVGAVVVVNLGRAAEQSRSAPPAGLVDGGIVVGAADAPVTVTVYADYLCPACASFDAENREQLHEWVADGTVRVDHRPIAILDRLSPDRYPTRAVAAAAAVVEVSPEAFPAFHDALYDAQPREGAPGPDDAALADLAVAAGADEAVRELVEEGRFVDWAAATTDAASRAGVTGTPTVLVDGVLVTDWSAPALRAAVERAGADG